MINNFSIEHKVKGKLRLVVRGLDGKDKIDTGWFDNLITNQGLDMMSGYLPAATGQAVVCNSVAVGTGNTVPTVTDTQLTSFLATVTSSFPGGTLAYIAGPPAYWSVVVTYVFAIGGVVGNIAEVGVGNITASTGSVVALFNHQLILVAGSPGTISVTSTDQLSVYFELDMYLNTTDTSYSFVMNSITYGGIYRIALISTPLSFIHYIKGDTNYDASVSFLAYNGVIGSITGSPSGAAGTGATTTNTAYSVGSYTVALTTSMSLPVCNLSGMISAFTFETNLCTYQFSCSPVLPKTSLSTIVLTWSVSWARYP